MDNYEFTLLPFNEQASYTWEHGNFIAVRREKDFVIKLYHVVIFFVEVFYCPEEIKIRKIRSFKSQRLLEPYLENENLSV